MPVKDIGDGTFEATLTADPEQGEHPVSATVVAGQESDLLAAELHVHEAAHADAAESGGASAMSPWLKWALPGLVLVAAGLFFIQRNKRARKGGLA